MRDWMLKLMIHCAIRRRWLVWTVSILLTLALGAASHRLKLDMRWSTLLPQTMPVVQEFKKIDNNFFQPGNMIVAISGPDPVVLETLTDEVTRLLEQELVCDRQVPVSDCKAAERYARYIYGKLPEAWLREHMLRLAKPKNVRRLGRILQDPRLLPFLIHLNDDFEAEYTEAENVKNQERQVVAALDAVQGFADTLDAAASGTVEEARISRTVRDVTIGRPYMFSLDNRMSLVMVASAIATDDIEYTPLLDKRIEKLLLPLAAKYPDYRIERTGFTAVGRDELDSVGPQTYMITGVAFVLVFLMLVWNFRSPLMPVLGLIPISAGIVWSVGIIALTLGAMNLFTVMIMVVLLGLGIDFSIHIINRFHEEIAARQSIQDALRYAVGETGQGVITGAVTTAISFFALMVAETKGIREFGFCAGTGVLVTLVAVLWMLPALLAAWAARKAGRNRLPEKSREFALLGEIAGWMGRHRYAVIFVSAVLTLAGFLAGMRLDWEWNFNKLEAKGLRSVELQDEIIDRFKLSISISFLTVPDVEQSRTLREKFKQKAVVGEVDDISLWVSRPDLDQSRIYLQTLREALEKNRPPLSFIEGDISDAGSSEIRSAGQRARLAEELDRLWANIVEIQALAFIGGQDRVLEKTRMLVADREHRREARLRNLADRFVESKAVDWSAFDRFAQAFSGKLHDQALRMAEGNERVTLSMVPEYIRAKYTGNRVPGFLLQIFPKKNLFEREDMEAFQEAVLKVHPNVTGLPQMMLNMNLQTIKEGKEAFLMALGAIVLVLLIDFRRPLVAALAILPLVSGIAFTLGVLWLLGEKLHYMNIIALPVMIGIGVDDGVHFFHRYIQEGRGGMVRAVTSVGRAMLMTSLTTMIGFGSLMFYLMRGMASLGLVLFIGVGSCLLGTFTLLPALARLSENHIMKEKK